jgi:MscS family membrane protein
MDLSQLNPQNLNPAVRDVLLRALLLLLVILFIWILRSAAARLIISPLRQLVNRTKNENDNLLVDAIERPLRLAIVGIAIRLATLFIDFGANISEFAIVLSRAILIAAVVFTIYNLIEMIAFTTVTLRRITGLQIEERLLPFLRTALKVVTLVIGILIIVQEFGYDANALIASFGVIGIGIALAAQDTASNVFSFTAIVSDNPFQVGDHIETEKVAGIVEHVGLRSTRLRRRDMAQLSVPNNQLASVPLTNWSRMNKRKLEFIVTLPYDTSTELLQEIIQRIKGILLAREHIEKDTIGVHLIRFRPDAIEIQVSAFIRLKELTTYLDETQAVNLAVLELLETLHLKPLRVM